MVSKVKCIYCEVPMKESFVRYKGMKLESLECPKCHDSIFTEKLLDKAISKLEAKRLAQEYVKHPMKIGNSWGFTFPKEVVDVFSLDNPKLDLKVHPNVAKNKIEILVKQK